jgi:hypothetical protein
MSCGEFDNLITLLYNRECKKERKINMKLYLTELIAVTTPSENIIALDKLRTEYGQPQRDERGSYYNVGDEVMYFLPSGVTANAVRQRQ